METETKRKAGQMWILLESSNFCFLHIQRLCYLGPVQASLIQCRGLGAIAFPRAL